MKRVPIKNNSNKPITSAQKRFLITLIEKVFPYSEETRNFYYKLIPFMSQEEAFKKIRQFLIWISSNYGTKIRKQNKNKLK